MSKYCLLVADDNRDTAETFAALVRMDGHEAHIAFDGESAYPGTSWIRRRRFVE